MMKQTKPLRQRALNSLAISAPLAIPFAISLYQLEDLTSLINCLARISLYVHGDASLDGSEDYNSTRNAASTSLHYKCWNIWFRIGSAVAEEQSIALTTTPPRSVDRLVDVPYAYLIHGLFPHDPAPCFNPS